ncbi:E3 ubiquitin-protein ligase At1g63170-like isoform X2 [Andrographis paniculata]|uniref:E3 ubiquitin-protein ligase At1g63170-like isoform X2 n=1 Tax=Andrographis paniculata TaxID=175694 RepID=UPI0021E8E990|nr:E3 ubiquitin-protein ligase At1g63170-like isoform X2 [Andrographis paniculata]
MEFNPTAETTMFSNTTTTSSAAAAVDPTPLLGDQISRVRRPPFLRRPPSLRGAAQFLRRASSRSRPMREPSVRVREAAAEEIEERQSDWAYSKPIVILDIVWNIAFVIVSISVLVMSQNETPSMPLRLWIIGYALQCVLHVVCVGTEYKKRYLQQGRESGGERGQFRYSRNYSNSSSGDDDIESGNYFSDHRRSDEETSVVKPLESANTMFSFIWWIIGFYWVSAGGQSLTTDSPQLYWLCITFLAFDVFFVVICVAVACVIGLAVCCCLPCIIALLYAVADQGASKEDIEKLPRYKFRKISESEKQNSEIQGSYGGVMTECDTDSPTDHVIPSEDAECCICLCSYDDGAELRELPCTHHFHSTCIDKWLYINATCPLCKFNILKNSSSQFGSEDP